MKIIRYSLLFLALLVGVTTMAAAEQDWLDTGVKAGEKAPVLQVVNTEGKAVTLSEIGGEKGTVLLFVRSADWCPYCKKQLKDWNAKAERFKEAGYQVVSVSYDSPEKLAEFAKKDMIDYPLLSDTDSATIEAFGILNKDMEEGSRFYGIPHPAVYVVAPDGTVTHRFSEEGYKERPEVDEVAEALGLGVKAE